MDHGVVYMHAHTYTIRDGICNEWTPTLTTCTYICRSNLPVTIYRKNDLLGMVFPTLDFKVLTSLSDPSNTAVLSWGTDARFNQQVRGGNIFS